MGVSSGNQSHMGASSGGSKSNECSIRHSQIARQAVKGLKTMVYFILKLMVTRSITKIQVVNHQTVGWTVSELLNKHKHMQISKGNI